MGMPWICRRLMRSMEQLIVIVLSPELHRYDELLASLCAMMNRRILHSEADVPRLFC